MIESEERIRVDRPVEEVFAYMDRPENQPEITPSLTRSETVDELPNGGKRVAYTYTMAGLDFEGHIEAVEYDPPNRIHWAMSGDLVGEIEWTFEGDDGGTAVTYATRYRLQGPVLDAVAGPVARRYNERELKRTLRNLRSRIEESGG